MMWKCFSDCVQCTVNAAPVTSDFALARKARLVHGIPLAIYEGFVGFKAMKHTPKGDPVGIYKGFVGFKTIKHTPKGDPVGIYEGFAKTAKTLERLEHLRPEPKKVFEGVSLQRGAKKAPPLEHLERSGEFKGVRERGEVFEGRGPGEATSDEISISRKDVVQYVPQSWLVCLKVVPITGIRSACMCFASPT